MSGKKRREGGVPPGKRSYVSLHERIEGIGIVLQCGHESVAHCPENSNTSSMYLGACVEGKVVVIKKIGYYENHMLRRVVDLQFDSSGEAIPYAAGDAGSSHEHLLRPNFRSLAYYVGRVHTEPERLPTDVATELVRKIVEFNKGQHVWPEIRARI